MKKSIVVLLIGLLALSAVISCSTARSKAVQNQVPSPNRIVLQLQNEDYGLADEWASFIILYVETVSDGPWDSPVDKLLPQPLDTKLSSYYYEHNHLLRDHVGLWCVKNDTLTLVPFYSVGYKRDSTQRKMVMTDEKMEDERTLGSPTRINYVLEGKTLRKCAIEPLDSIFGFGPDEYDEVYVIKKNRSLLKQLNRDASND